MINKQIKNDEETKQWWKNIKTTKKGRWQQQTNKTKQWRKEEKEKVGITRIRDEMDKAIKMKRIK